LIRSLGSSAEDDPLEGFMDGFQGHEQFQTLTIQLIESLVSVDLELISTLVGCLSCILRLDPIIVYTTSAMDLVFHFLETTPAHPMIRHNLLETIESCVLRKLWSVSHDKETEATRGNEVRWLVKVVEMVQEASSRRKDDPLSTVFSSLYVGTDEGCRWSSCGVLDLVVWTIAGRACHRCVSSSGNSITS